VRGRRAGGFGLRALPLAAALGLVLVAGAAADPGVPFEFQESGPVSTNCAELLRGKDITLRNVSASRQTLHLRRSAITDSSGHTLRSSEVCGSLSVKVVSPRHSVIRGRPTRTIVQPGETVIVRLQGLTAPLPEPTKPVPVFSVDLIAFGRSGSASRRSLNIRETKATGLDAAPLVESRSFTHHRVDPFDHWVVWVPVKLASNETPSLHNPSTVGALTGDGGTIPVTYQGGKLQKLTDTTSLLPLHLKAIGAGTYTGNVFLTPDRPDKGKLSLTLTSKHWWPFAVLALILGTGIGLLLQRWNGYWSPRGRLMQRVNDLDDRRLKARQRLQDAASAQGTPPRPWGSFDIAGLEDVESDLDTTINSRTRRTLIQIDQKVVDELDAKVAAVEAQIDAFDILAANAAAIDELVAFAEPSPMPPLLGSDMLTGEPALVGKATQLLKGSALPAPALADRATTLGAMAEALAQLRAQEQEVSLYWAQAAQLETAAEPAWEISDLRRDLVGVRHWLWDGETTHEVDEFENLRDARDTIGWLWSSLGAPGADVGGTEEGVGMTQLVAPGPGGPSAPAAAEAPRPLVVPTPPAVAVATEATPPPEMSAAHADSIIRGARMRQRLVVAISALVAVISGLTALYIGKTWGTVWDYVAAVTWGIATQGVVLALAGAIDGLGPLGALRHGIGAHGKAP
jgi:hypothetical protein